MILQIPDINQKLFWKFPGIVVSISYFLWFSFLGSSDFVSWFDELAYEHRRQNIIMKVFYGWMIFFGLFDSPDIFVPPYN